MENQIIPLERLLQLGYPGKTTWLGEPQPAGVQIAWAVTQVAEVGPGDLLVILGVELRAGLVGEVKARGGAAILIIGPAAASGPGLPPGLPIASLPGEETPREVQRTLVNILVNQRAYLMERGVRIHARLSKIAAEGEGLAGLSREMSELSGRGVLVQDKRLQVLAEWAPASLAAIWQDVLSQLGEAGNLPEAFADRKKAGKESLILHQALLEGLERIVTPISAGGVARGYLSLIDSRQQLDALDHLIAEQGALVCAIEMRRAKAVREAEKKLKGDLLTALLQEDLAPRDVNLWVKRMGLDLQQAHVAIRFAWEAPSPPSLRRLETIVNGEVSGRGLQVIVETLGSEVLCICQVETASSRPETALELAEGVLKTAAQEYPGIAVRAGIGRPAGEISFWRDSFRQAGQALEMARRLQSKEPRYYPDLSVYRLLLQLEHHPDLNAFRDEILGSLLAYEGGGDFIKTLEAYFEHNGNLSQTAEALYIHRNTLTYRMERIAEITGLDLDHTETRLAVQLALRIMQFAQK